MNAQNLMVVGAAAAAVLLVLRMLGGKDEQQAQSYWARLEGNTGYPVQAMTVTA